MIAQVLFLSDIVVVLLDTWVLSWIVTNIKDFYLSTSMIHCENMYIHFRILALLWSQIRFDSESISNQMASKWSRLILKDQQANMVTKAFHMHKFEWYQHQFIGCLAIAEGSQLCSKGSEKILANSVLCYESPGLAWLERHLDRYK
jgi:hypothetical protein